MKNQRLAHALFTVDRTLISKRRRVRASRAHVDETQGFRRFHRPLRNQQYRNFLFVAYGPPQPAPRGACRDEADRRAAAGVIVRVKQPALGGLLLGAVLDLRGVDTEVVEDPARC